MMTEANTTRNRPHGDKLFSAACECTEQFIPDRWEWRGREHLRGLCRCHRRADVGALKLLGAEPDPQVTAAISQVLGEDA